MKDWCKIIESDDFDLLVVKTYDDSEDMFGIKLTVKYEEVELSQSLLYKEEVKRDDDFSNLPDTTYEDAGKAMYSLLKEGLQDD